MASANLHPRLVDRERGIHHLSGEGSPITLGLIAPDGTKYDDVTKGSGSAWQMVNGTWVQFGASGVAAWSTVTGIPTPLSAVALPAESRTVTTFQDYTFHNRTFNVRDYGAAGDGTTDDTAAIQAAINAAHPTKSRVAFSPASYLVTNSLTIYEGTRLQGINDDQYTTGFGIQPLGSTIIFAPTSVKDLYVVGGTTYSGLVFHISISGLYASAGNANARYAYNLQGVIYSKFSDLSADGFVALIYCSSTINNRFVNCNGNGTTASVIYAGNNETTDVWTQCTFNGPPSGVGTPTGVQFLGSSIAIRFINCLWEQINNYGLDIARECQDIQVVNGYCEDVPFANNANGAMFRVGYAGASLVVENHLTVIGGKYAGRNAGTVGQFLDTDYCNGVQLVGVNHSRFTNIIRTTANTRTNSIVISGAVGIGWTTFATDTSKINGVYPNSVVNSGSSQGQAARFAGVSSTSVSTPIVYANEVVASFIRSSLSQSYLLPTATTWQPVSVGAGSAYLVTVTSSTAGQDWGGAALFWTDTGGALSVLTLSATAGCAFITTGNIPGVNNTSGASQQAAFSFVGIG